MTIAETQRSASAPRNSSAERTQNRTEESSRLPESRRKDALNFLQEVNNTAYVLPQIFSPVSTSDNSVDARRDTTFGAHGTASVMFSQAAGDSSADFISGTIIQKMLRDPALQNMSFSIQNRHGQVSVEAAIANGHMRCTLATASEKLRRRLHGARQQIISRLGDHLRIPIELDIEE